MTDNPKDAKEMWPVFDSVAELEHIRHAPSKGL